MNLTVGFIGPGTMGQPMARNLLNAGYPLYLYGRRAEACRPLEAAGAVVCASPAEVAEQAQVVFTMVSDIDDVEQVTLGTYGLIHGTSHGDTVVDMSTVSPIGTRRIADRLAEHGVDMLDAPVSGGEQGAIEGRLSVMVGGPEAAFERVRPLLEILGSTVVRIGQHGAGQIAKMCNQILVAQHLNATAETLRLARAAGADPERVREALLGGFGYSRVLEVHGQRMLQEDFQPGFKAQLHQKDMRIALEAAHAHGVPLPGGALAAQLLNAVVGRGEGDLDSAALARVLDPPRDSG